MRYYTIPNGNLLIADSFNALARYYSDVLPLPEDYEEGKYIIVEHKEEIEVPDFDPETGETIGTHTEVKVAYTLELNPNFEAEKEAKERKRILELSMSKSDFFDGTIKAFGADQDDLLPAIQAILNEMPLSDIDKKVALNNYKNAKDFYRKHALFAILSDREIVLTPEVIINISSQQWDKFFDETSKKNPEAYKELLPTPVVEEEGVEPVESGVEIPTIEEEIEETQGE